MADANNVSAAILAGGRSTRMGRDKAALPFAGTTLLEYQVDKVKKLGITDIMISGGDGTVPGTRPVKDRYADCGPLGGIHACLEEAAQTAVLFLSVDTPLVPEEALDALVRAHRGGITLLRHEKQEEPLIGVYDKAMGADAETLLESGETSPWVLIHRHPVTDVPVPGDAILFSGCNTPKEYEELIERFNFGLNNG